MYWNSIYHLLSHPCHTVKFTLNGKTWHVGSDNWPSVDMLEAAILLSGVLVALPRSQITRGYNQLSKSERIGSLSRPAVITQLQNIVERAMAKQGHPMPAGNCLYTVTQEEPRGRELGIVFSAMQTEALSHHLSTPELIANDLEAEHGDRVAIIETAQSLLEHATKCLVPHAAYEGEVAQAILRHAVEHSTWMIAQKQAKEAWTLSYAKYHGCRKSMQNLAQCLRDNGIECGEAPSC
jgi:hypothetical protein